jgi:tetratricopeptide (TPR) repeat protein
MKKTAVTRYTLILIFMLVIRITGAFAQDTPDPASIEQKSYQLYTDKKWPELISLGKQAVRSGVDYFYLEMRIGIAYYERKNYSYAAPHFKKALSFNSTDSTALEYLYYCYVYTGRFEESRMLSKKFSPELAKKTGADRFSPIDLVMLEGGTKKTDSSSYYDVHRKTNANYFNPAVYLQLGLDHYIKKKISVYHAFTYFDQQTFLGRNRQIQYYLKAAIPIKNNWLISPAFQVVSRKSIIKINPQLPLGNLPGPPPRPRTITSKSTDFIGSLAVQKTIKKVTASLGTTVSSLDSSLQYIHFGSLSLAPFGNNRLMIGCTGYVHTADTYSTLNTAISPYLYVQPLKRVSITASYFMNEGNNIIEGNGYLVNNSVDLTTSRWSVLADVKLSRHISLYGLYQLEYKQEAVQLFGYRYNVIVGGIRITP